MTNVEPRAMLVELFRRLRDEAQLPLGVDEFLLLFAAIERGYGAPDREALRRLCHLIWANSREESRLLDHYFDAVIPPALTIAALRAGREAAIRPAPATPQPTPTPATRPRTTEPPPPEMSRPAETPVTPQPVDSAPAQVMEDPALAARVTLRVVADRAGSTVGRFELDDEGIFPLTRRQMQQSWRHLRRIVREGPPVELDVAATVRQIARQGVLLAPVLVPRRVNRAGLLLLLDRDGSMVPFHELSHRLAETALRGGRVRHAQLFTFHNCPVDHLYAPGDPPQAMPIEEVLRRLPAGAAALIVSDAGAARGRTSPERVAQTAMFLDRLQQTTPRIAWLNPMPAERWPRSSAGPISRLVPMFELGRAGLEAAIAVLRGRNV